MDCDRISEGNEENEAGIKYNSKILAMIKNIQSIPDIGRYRYEVIILANVKKDYSQSALKKLTGGFPVKVFDFDKCYKELVFPVVSGTFYNANEIIINLSLSDKESSEGKISYSVKTEYKDCKIMVVFVPLIEIARVMYRYKNAILRYNPRCFLSLTNNDVNPKIQSTVLKKKTNEFALFNNGITILSDATEFSSKVAIKDRAQLIIENPQIINGGQTSYTLAQIYENCLANQDFTPFDNKEVLTKIITFVEASSDTSEQKLDLIEALSRATNEQSYVRESDRRSNDKVQILYQERIFDDLGYFYNRKRGEFHDGLKSNYIDKNKIVDNSVFIRVALSSCGEVAKARRNSDDILFREDNFKQIFKNDNSYRKYMFAYMVHEYLIDHEKKYEKTKNNKYGTNTYGYAIRFGKYAVVNAVSNFYKEDFELEMYKEYSQKITDQVLSQWVDFEKYVSSKNYNSDYFYILYDEDGKPEKHYNYDGYYKGRNINYDLKHYKFKLYNEEQQVLQEII
ncbi:MAG: AIPR family protein [Clostridiaceae bacterium]